MKYREYVEKLQLNDYDLEPGMLSSLEIDVPDELHGNIMRKVRLQRRNSLFKTFSSIAAAVLIFIISITGIKDTLKLPVETDNKTAKSDITFNVPKGEIDHKRTEVNKIEPMEQIKKAAIVSEKKNETINSNAKAKKTKNNSTKTLIALNNNTPSSKTIVSDVTNTITIPEKSEQKEQQNKETIYNEQIDASNLRNTNNNTVANKNFTMSALVTMSFPIDYIITVNKNQGDVLSFIYNNPNILLIDANNNIYRIQRQDFNVLSDMINYQTSIYNDTGILNINSYSPNYIKEYYFAKIIIK